MRYLTGIINRICSKAGIMLILAGVIITGCGQSTKSIPPAQGVDVVTGQFFEHISEAKLTGGTTPLREAYKLISSKKSHLSQAKFIEIVSKYPPGFKADITRTEINGTQGKVTITYKMPSAFGDYMVTTDILLSVDEANTWKIDFTGEMDSQKKLVADKGSQ